MTDRGKKLIDDLLPDHVENERKILASLSKPEQVEFNRLLAKLLQG